MASYYTRVDGTLKTGQTARSSDIHLIQSEVQDALQKALLDIHGTGVILGEEENALRLEPTTNHVDQSNLNFNEENPGLSCYEIYFAVFLFPFSIPIFFGERNDSHIDEISPDEQLVVNNVFHNVGFFLLPQAKPDVAEPHIRAVVL